MKASEMKCPKCGALGFKDIAPENEYPPPPDPRALSTRGRSWATQGTCPNGHVRIFGTSQDGAEGEYSERVFE